MIQINQYNERQQLSVTREKRRIEEERTKQQQEKTKQLEITGNLFKNQQNMHKSIGLNSKNSFQHSVFSFDSEGRPYIINNLIASETSPGLQVCVYLFKIEK